MYWRSLVASLVMLFATIPALAQFDTAQVSGVVRDTTGAILPGVDVTLVNVGTSNERRAVTNDTGLYTFTNVPVGEYRLTATTPSSAASRTPSGWRWRTTATCRTAGSRHAP